MIHLCRSCEVCNLPKQTQPRLPYYQEGEGQPKVLLIDDNDRGAGTYGSSHDNGLILFGQTPFTYTSTIRCEAGGIAEDDRIKAVSRCAVWTNLLCGGRSIIVSTLTGLLQMGVSGVHRVGDVFTDDGLGIVIVIPPLSEISVDAMKTEWKPKVRRALKEAGII